MEVYDALFSAIFNLLSIYIDIRVIKLFLPVKKVKTVYSLLLCLGVWAINWLVYYFFNIPNLTTLSLWMGLLIVAVILFEGSIWRKIFAVTVSNASGIIAENIVWKISFEVPFLVENEVTGVLCSVILRLLIVLCLERLIFQKQYRKLPTGGYANIVFIAVGSVILSETITIQNYSNEAVLICMSVICLMNLSTYYIYEKMAELWGEKIRNAEMEQQIRMYANQFDIIKESQENIRSLRHDMKNHLALIGVYLQNKEYQRAEEYIAELGENLNTSKGYVKTGNVEIDSILNYKLEYGEKKAGSDIKIQIDVPEQPFMSAFDLNVLLSNLLDNSIEAVQKVNDRFIDIRIGFSQSVLYISVYNTFDGKINKEQGKIFSRKKDAEQHGVGLENVKRIVDKYNGTMQMSYDNEIFKIDIIMFLETTRV